MRSPSCAGRAPTVAQPSRRDAARSGSRAMSTNGASGLVAASGADARQPHRPRRQPRRWPRRPGARPRPPAAATLLAAPLDDGDRVALADARRRVVLARRGPGGSAQAHRSSRAAPTSTSSSRRRPGHAARGRGSRGRSRRWRCRAHSIRSRRRGAGHVQPAHDAPVVRPQVVAGRRGQAVLLFGAQIGASSAAAARDSRRA